MFSSLIRPLITLGTFTFLALILGSVSTAVYGWAFYSLSLLFMVMYHLYNLNALDKWLKHGDAALLPDASGVWETIFSGLYRQSRTQTKSRERLSATLERFRQASSAMPDGVVILDEGDRIEWCNVMAENHFNIDSKRDRGQLITHFLRQPQFSTYMESGNVRDPVVLRPAHKLDMQLSLQIVPFDTTHKLLLSRDVTQLEKVETMRRDFVANVSHELRTPLTVVGGFLETLTDMENPDPDKIRQYQLLMLQQTQRMQRLVEDLLTLSRLESQSNALCDEPINMPLLLQSLHQDALTLSRGRHQIVLDLMSDNWLLGNEDELRSAIGNLLSNAVRYTPEGGEIFLRWLVKNDQGIVTVQDRGIGMDSQHIPRLTERFYRIDNSRSRETGGTGLGLAIVKHIVSRHQATLDIRSEAGKGSRFSIYFPARRLSPPPEAFHSQSEIKVTRS